MYYKNTAPSLASSSECPSANPTLINPDVKADSLRHEYKHTLQSFKHHLIPQRASCSHPSAITHMLLLDRLLQRVNHSYFTEITQPKHC